MSDTVYLKPGAQDIEGRQLDCRTEYRLLLEKEHIALISNGYRDIYIKPKYIKKPRA